MGKTKKASSPLETAVKEMGAERKNEGDAKRRKKHKSPSPGTPILWTNLPMVMERWGLDEKEATEALLATIGPMPEGEKYIKKHCPEVLQDAAKKSLPSSASNPETAETQELPTQKEASSSEEEAGIFEPKMHPEDMKDVSDDESTEEEEKVEDATVTEKGPDGSAPCRLGTLANASGI